MTIAIIINDAPYGNEKAYNALRLAMILQRKPTNQLRIFLTGDAVTCAIKDQQPPPEYYNIGAMLESVVRKNGDVRTCVTCQKARGLDESDFIDGVKTGSTVQLAEWVEASDRVISY